VLRGTRRNGGEIANRAASTGAFANLTTTKLLTVEGASDALRRGGDIEYCAPAPPGR
jgi:hypothetical protein